MTINEIDEKINSFKNEEIDKMNENVINAASKLALEFIKLKNK